MEKYELIDSPEWEPTKSNLNSLISEIKDNIDDWNYEGSATDIGNGWQYECEGRFGGYEGAGEEHWIVFSLTKDNIKRYFQIDGYYQSYAGSSLDGEPYEVEQEEKTILVWVKK